MRKTTCTQHARLAAHSTGRHVEIWSRRKPHGIKGSPRDYIWRFSGETDDLAGKGYEFDHALESAVTRD